MPVVKVKCRACWRIFTAAYLTENGQPPYCAACLLERIRATADEAARAGKEPFTRKQYEIFEYAVGLISSLRQAGARDAECTCIEGLEG